MSVILHWALQHPERTVTGLRRAACPRWHRVLRRQPQLAALPPEGTGCSRRIIRVQCTIQLELRMLVVVGHKLNTKEDRDTVKAFPHGRVEGHLQSKLQHLWPPIPVVIFAPCARMIGQSLRSLDNPLPRPRGGSAHEAVLTHMHLSARNHP
eukprot:1175933-Pleurochrysis_carterae.AAC.1